VCVCSSERSLRKNWLPLFWPMAGNSSRITRFPNAPQWPSRFYITNFNNIIIIIVIQSRYITVLHSRYTERCTLSCFVHVRIIILSIYYFIYIVTGANVIEKRRRLNDNNITAVIRVGLNWAHDGGEGNFPRTQVFLKSSYMFSLLPTFIAYAYRPLKLYYHFFVKNTYIGT